MNGLRLELLSLQLHLLIQIVLASREQSKNQLNILAEKLHIGRDEDMGMPNDR